MGLSRNKVAVPEGAAGSPPFYGVFRTPVWRPSCGPCVGNGSRFRVGVLVWKRSWALGFLFGGSGEWYGYAFGLPDRHPRLVVACGFPDAPGGTPWACGPRVVSWRGAWWFENWIVDASNAMNSVSSFALSRFRQALFLESGFEIDRFVIIFYSVMICRLA